MPRSAAVVAARSFPKGVWHPLAPDTYHLLGSTTTGSRVLLSPVVFVLRPHCASAPPWRGPVVIRTTGTGSARDVVRCFRRFQRLVQGPPHFSRVLAVLPHLLEFEIVPRLSAISFKKMRAHCRPRQSVPKRGDVKNPSCPHEIDQHSTLPLRPVLPGRGTQLTCRARHR